MRNSKTNELVLTGLFTAIIIIMAFTPLGYIPLVVIKNTKDERVPPTIVAFKQLVNPNTNPRNAPFLGPQKSEPRITGM